MTAKQHYTAEIKITLKKGVLDPQGKTILHSLHTLGFETAREVRFGKFVRLEMEGKSREEVEAEAGDMCRKLLTNPVIEDFEIEITPAS